MRIERSAGLRGCSVATPRYGGMLFSTRRHGLQRGLDRTGCLKGRFRNVSRQVSECRSISRFIYLGFEVSFSNVYYFIIYCISVRTTNDCCVVPLNFASRFTFLFAEFLPIRTAVCYCTCSHMLYLRCYKAHSVLALNAWRVTNLK
jgi:hypothetical protein